MAHKFRPGDRVIVPSGELGTVLQEDTTSGYSVYRVSVHDGQLALVPEDELAAYSGEPEAPAPAPEPVPEPEPLGTTAFPPAPDWPAPTA
ncbi:hypothetical protein ATK30_6843 [Amycolatopsis echigonensis]|uniref:Uncharacterized protein n=1 Tax=Amycolatopsis echigonensis TaxID=2576905 RepID=A0A2N3WPY1_9PSEU|nr:hypothetical protein [Amycolatopsis niigatensis]PKV95910.1 hypothetical protein ATK30_6843 [Amycolatopsis niigatensis]